MLRTLVGAGLLLMALCLAPGNAHAQVWLNTQLNNDSSGQVHNEEQVVVNPTNPNNVVAVWRDFRLGYRQIGYGYTVDAGRTWTNPGLFVEHHYQWDSDPALTVSRTGTFYAMLLTYTDTSHPNGFLLEKSTDSGVSWTEQGFAVNQVSGVFEDKELIACDRNALSPFRGRIYCTWDRFNETNIYCVASGNEGLTWTTPHRVSDQSSNQFPTPAVGPDGTLYVAWTYYGGNLRLDKSTDGGVTFGSDINITTIYNPAPTLNGGVDAICSPALDADISGGTYNGRLYCLYMNKASGSNDYDIYLRYSTDRGATWSSPIRVNDDTFNNGRDQFHCWLTVDNRGILTAVWLDRRQDPANLQWYSYISQSTNGGTTWSPNQQVSTAPSDPSHMLAGREVTTIDYAADRAEKMARGPVLESGEEAAEAGPGSGGTDPSIDDGNGNTRSGVIGEYIGIASYDGFATAVWTDTRNGHQDTYGGINPALLAVDPIAGATDDRSLLAAPNPASGSTDLAYLVPSDGWVDLQVYDVGGRLVRTLVGRNIRAGSYRFTWNGTDQGGEKVAPGTYYVRYRAPGLERSTKVGILP